MRLTPQEYLELERKAEFRSEYVDGEMIAKSGGTYDHARIVVATACSLAKQLERSTCEIAMTDLRLFSARHQAFVYPDLVVMCGAVQCLDACQDTITDATAVIEVLSPSTKNYDRSQKFDFYRSLPSFAEYLLLAQDEIRAELHVRLPDASWLFREFTSPGDIIELKSIGCHLELQTLYDRVEFGQ